MSQTIAAIGEQALLEGFRLAGARLYPCQDEAQTLLAWKEMPDDTAVVILTQRSARALGGLIADASSPMSVVVVP